MGIIAQTPCVAGAQKNLYLDGRLQVLSATKEIIRQLPFAVEGDLTSNVDYIFQRTLTSTSPSAVWPVDNTRQFYCPVTLTGATKTLNSVEGTDNFNYRQPNFVYVISDAPVKLTFGYTTSTTQFRDPSNLANPLNPQPWNLNMTYLVNGEWVFTSGNTTKIAPATAAEVTNWGVNYSGFLGDLGGTGMTWTQCGGKTDSSIVFPLKIEKSSAVANTKITIYAALIA